MNTFRALNITAMTLLAALVAACGSPQAPVTGSPRTSPAAVQTTESAPSCGQRAACCEEAVAASPDLSLVCQLAATDADCDLGLSAVREQLTAQRVAWPPSCCPSPGDPGVTWAGTNAESCAEIDFVCADAEIAFDGPCGCGCLR